MNTRYQVLQSFEKHGLEKNILKVLHRILMKFFSNRYKFVNFWNFLI
jgi:hypothetical protein